MRVRMLLLTALVSAMMPSAFAYSESEWRIRPWEIIKGLKPHSKALWETDQNSIAGWTVSGAGAEISETDVTKLWGEKVTKITFPKGGNLTITPAEPIEVPNQVDGFDLWIYGPINGPPGAAPQIALQVTDADGKNFKLLFSGSGSRWDLKRWWGMGAVFVPPAMKFPAKITAIRVTGLTTKFKDDFFCIDRLGAFHYTPATDLPDTSKWDVPFPTAPNGIMPRSMGKNGKNSVSTVGNSCVFRYQGEDAEVTYTYTPKTGTLSDIQAEFNGEKFQPAVKGGVRVQAGDVSMLPGDAEIKATKLAAKLDGDTFKTRWRWTKAGKKYTFNLNFSIHGKTLMVEASSNALDATAFDMGEMHNVPSPRLFDVSYLNNRWDAPQFVATKNFIVSGLIDWYSSNSSQLVEKNPAGILPGAEILGENAVRSMGGAIYSEKTDGKRNPLYEKVFFTVSAELDDTLPHIANPPSKFLGEMAKTVCMTRMYCQQENYLADQKNELEFWKKMKAWGAEDMLVRFHEAKFRTPIQNNRICRSLEGAQHLGGDETLKSLAAGMLKYVKRCGPYNNGRIVACNAPEFEYRYISQRPDRSFLNGWDGCFRPKAMATYKWSQTFAPAMAAKYGWNMEYLDEMDNCPPWGDVDFEATVPNAGKFSDILRNYGLIMLQEKELYQGPVWSEGCAAYFYAGLTDIDYAVSNEEVDAIPLVNFKLKEINPLNAYTGTTWSVIHSGNPDLHLATEIAYGNVGHLIASMNPAVNLLPIMGLIADLRYEDYAGVLKTYFMIRQVQEFYTGVAPDTILYETGGKMLTAGEMLRGNHPNSGRIYAHYPNGLETWVNRGKEGNWTVKVDGKTYELPPNGYAAYLKDKLLEYSALVSGHRVDYSRGALYTYMNGNGVLTEFPEMSAAYAYLLRSREEGTSQLIPLPFQKAETVKGLNFRTAKPLDVDGKVLGEAKNMVSTGAGKSDLPVDGQAFSYQLQ